MKKNLFLLGLAVAAMTSCTNDEVVQMSDSNVIKFNGFVNKATRAITETDESLVKFYIWGNYGTTSVFTGETVTGTVGSNFWNYSGGDKFWTSNEYGFAAYANGNNNNHIEGVSFTNSSNTYTLEIPNVTINYTTTMEGNTPTAVTNDTGNDLVADFVRTDKVSSIELTFKHLLSKIQFKIVNNSSQNLTMDITDLKINGVQSKATFSSTVPENSGFDEWNPVTSDWKNHASPVTNFYPVLAASDKIAKSASYDSNEYYVIPQDLSNVTYTITANFYQGNGLVSTKEITAKAFDETVNHDWEPGKSYIYTINLPSAGNKIEFTVPDVKGWESSSIELN